MVLYKRGECMNKKQKIITIRVDTQLKFEIEKIAFAEGHKTINSWMIKVITKYIENEKK